MNCFVIGGDTSVGFSRLHFETFMIRLLLAQPEVIVEVTWLSRHNQCVKLVGNNTFFEVLKME